MSENDRILLIAKIKKYDDELYKLIAYPDKTPKPKFKCDFSPINIPSSIIKSDESFSRTKSKIFEYAYCNDFDYFITLTLDPKKNDYSKNLKIYISKLSRFFRYYRTQYNANIQYLLVPERHQSGAWHFHGLIKGIPKNKLSINKHGFLDWLDYQSRFGFISLSPVRSKIAISRYITKYITKTLLQDRHAKSYYASRGLKTVEEVFSYLGHDEMYLFKDILSKIKFDNENRYSKTKFMNKDFLETVFKKLLDNNLVFNSQVDQYMEDYYDVID